MNKDDNKPNEEIISDIMKRRKNVLNRLANDNNPIMINEEQAKIIAEAPIWKPNHDLDYTLISELPEDEQKEYYDKLFEHNKKLILKTMKCNCEYNK